jgi:hypothetical protein
MLRYSASLVAAGILAGASMGADLKSGPQPGESVPVFNPLNVTGPWTGEKQCPV